MGGALCVHISGLDYETLTIQILCNMLRIAYRFSKKSGTTSRPAFSRRPLPCRYEKHPFTFPVVVRAGLEKLPKGVLTRRMLSLTWSEGSGEGYPEGLGLEVNGDFLGHSTQGWHCVERGGQIRELASS